MYGPCSVAAVVLVAVPTMLPTEMIACVTFTEAVLYDDFSAGDAGRRNHR
jgi:hypothetical protein